MTGSAAGQSADPLFRTWDFFLVRAPLLATEEPAGLSVRAGRDTAAYLDLIRALGADERLTEAIAIASPSLSVVLHRVLAGQSEGLKAAQLRRAALATLRYSIRMRSRPTPFGLFAGVCLGEFGRSARLDIHGPPRTRTHLDMDWLSRVVRRLEDDAALLPALRVQAHQALISRGGRLVLTVPVAAGADPGGSASRMISVSNTFAVQEVISRARTPLSFAELTGALQARLTRTPPDRIEAMLRRLVRHDILLTELRPPLDGGDPLAHVIAVLAAAPHRGRGSEELLEQLRVIGRLRRCYDAAPPGRGRAALGELTRRAVAVQPHAMPLRVDTRLDLQAELPPNVRTEIERMADTLWRLSPPRRGPAALRGFHAMFLERYGTERLVRLLDLTDEATGLGYPAGYRWPASETPESPAQAAADPVSAGPVSAGPVSAGPVSAGPASGPASAGAASAPSALPGPDSPQESAGTVRDLTLGYLYARAAREHQPEVVLDEALVRALAGGPPDPGSLPDSGELYVHVVAASPGDMTAGRFLVVLAPGPVSQHAGASLGRFADQLPRRGEPVPAAGGLPVDLAYAPCSTRAANLVQVIRPARQRIAVGLMDSPGAEALRLGDVAIGADSCGLYAVHLPTSQPIIPVAPNMVSLEHHAPNLARLLHEIGLERQRQIEPWRWGPMAMAPFLPRVRYGRAVLAPATWRLDELRAKLTVGAGGWAALAGRWRRRWGVPSLVLVVSGDQRLQLDLTCRWHLELLRDEIRKDARLIVTEVPGAAEGWLGGDTAGHVVEFVVPFVRRDPAGPAGPRAARIDPARQSGQDSGWLSLKVYCARRSQDDILRSLVPAMVGAAAEHGADRWFFVRYRDPGGHYLRLRFHADPERLWSQTWPALRALLADGQWQGLIGAHQVDQYDPEFERYGGSAALPAAEGVFEQDSIAALGLLQLAGEPGCPYPLDALAAMSVAALACSFGPAPPGYGGDTAAAWLSATGERRQLPVQYRRNRPYWRGLIDPAGGWPHLRGDEHGERVLAAIAGRDLAARRFGDQVGGLDGDRGRMVASFLHLTCNRLTGGLPDREQLILGIARGAVQDHYRRRDRCNRMLIGAKPLAKRGAGSWASAGNACSDAGNLAAASGGGKAGELWILIRRGTPRRPPGRKSIGCVTAGLARSRPLSLYASSSRPWSRPALASTTPRSPSWPAFSPRRGSGPARRT